ncbi:suppressor of fused protein SUFU [Actinoplanes lutulentus]|uniref:Suppressor of fused protein SUFU n=2 Tax=Actinoplanes lutulentus TaxID=1287878 RepID=A0A327YY36_9ACTN|nr:suppressor of fused protein SUFU [Actinoplanes lutulentus]
MPDRFERYRELLDSLSEVTPVVTDIEPRVAADGPVRAISCIGFPEPQYITGFTYGLSLANHPDWGGRARELCITVRSSEVEWSRIPARIVAALRGICPFNSGQVLGYKEPYVASSPMSSVALAAPASERIPPVLDLDGDHIEMIGVYPIFASERELAYSRGFDALWGLTWDRFDPLRTPAA